MSVALPWQHIGYYNATTISGLVANSLAPLLSSTVRYIYIYIYIAHVLFSKRNEMCLLLGATGVGKTLLLKRLHNILCVVCVWTDEIYNDCRVE